eukprot:EG_transcript_5426
MDASKEPQPAAVEGPAPLSSVQLVVFIIGTTGAGKSKLAVDLALALQQQHGLSCEVINADVMQMFQGLDIATNKVTPADMAGVPHHLLAFLAPDVASFHVTKYRDLALPLIRGVLAAGRLPIVVGGSHYYVESLLFETLIGDGAAPEGPPAGEPVPEAPVGRGPSWEHLSEKSDARTMEQAHEALCRVDPAMAQRLHPHNARKVRRALEFFHRTGNRLSDRLAQQAKHVVRFPDHVLLYLDADRECLGRRLDRRVDAMVRRGLVAEVEAFYAAHHRPSASDAASAGDLADPAASEEEDEADFSHGLLQSIGLKEFHPYLAERCNGSSSSDVADNGVSSVELASCIEALKTNTRRYANRQRQWIRNRFAIHSHLRLFTLDSTGAADVDEPRDPARWAGAVVQPAAAIVGDAWQGRDTAALHAERRLLLGKRSGDAAADRMHRCDVCERDIHGEAQWAAHLRSRPHRKKQDGQRRRRQREGDLP